MAFRRELKNFLRAFTGASEDPEYANLDALAPEGTLPCDEDTLAVIRDLSRAVMQDPDSVDIYLALGNLFRSRGEIDRALQIREGLLARPELKGVSKGRACFEMGRDYRRAGLMDRALEAYAQSQRNGFPNRLVNAELAALYADSGAFAEAARHYAAIGNKDAEAHFMICEARELLAEGRHPEGERLVKKALKVQPARPEGWALLIGLRTPGARLAPKNSGNWRQAAGLLQSGLDAVPADKIFLLFEELLNAPAEGLDPTAHFQNMAKNFLPPLTKHGAIQAQYYAARLQTLAGEAEEAGIHLAKALVLDPDFWPARLLLLRVSITQHKLPPVLDGQIEYFLKKSEETKRFYCSNCGLQMERLFHTCPRCRSWSSISLRIK